MQGASFAADAAATEGPVPTGPPKRIAFVRQRYTAGGGAERIIERAIERLRLRQQVEVTVLARRWPEQAGIKGIRIDPWHMGRTWRDASFERAVEACIARERFDLVQSHERIAGATIFRAGDGIHAGWLERWLPTLPAWRRALVRASPYHRFTLARERRMFADQGLRAVIANSQFVANDVIRHFPSAAPLIRVIRNGVDSTHFHPGLREQHRAATRTALGIPANARALLFLGSGFERKGLATAIRTLATLPTDVHLVIVGRDRRQGRFRALAHGLGVESRTRWLGAVSDPRPQLGACDAAILPSLYDPMPNSVLESMACGLPVAASTFTGATDLIRHRENGVLAHPLDQAAWNLETAWLLDPANTARLGVAARTSVEPLTMEAMVDGWTSLYEALLARSDHG
jgi:UDP-glucose:(heptosyl)LPS alpha-1,3-glucosyltransferase